MNIYITVTDGRVLRAIGRRYMTDFDKKFKYCLTPSQCPPRMEYKGDIYRLMYVDGCFYPYLVKLEDVPPFEVLDVEYGGKHYDSLGAALEDMAANLYEKLKGEM